MSKELKALAEAATPGPWVQWVENAAVYAGKPEVNRKGAILPGKGERIARICEGDLFDPTEQELADHAYIAAANPAAILELISERDALLAERDRLREALKYYADGEHFCLANEDAWDTVSGEPLNILHHDDGFGESEGYVEDGSIARAALQGAQP